MARTMHNNQQRMLSDAGEKRVRGGKYYEIEPG
jgi:hypothetical protein